MVQRKVNSKLGIQADRLKTEKLLVKPSAQHPDAKNRGPDMKKKKMMKISTSIKLSHIDHTLGSTPFRKSLPQPGRPPPSNVVTTQKHSPVTPADGSSPNYMKATTSSEARKETSQVSPRSKILHRRISASPHLGSASGNKPVRSLTKSSSLKMVRTLTKVPSFKRERASAKKCSPVALCVDVNPQKATCSSTLKDSKFPAYLMLNPGGTEAQGTSAVKVCPYNYCSLNGHRHAPLTPLKSFVSARRRLLKIQKSVKLEVLSPRKTKPSAGEIKKIETEHLMFDEEPACSPLDMSKSPMSPLVQENSTDFVLEIFAKSKEDDGEANERNKLKDYEEAIDFAGEAENQNGSSFGGNNEVTAEKNINNQVAESLSDESPRSQIESEESIGQYKDISSMEIDIVEGFPKKQTVEDAEEETGSDFDGESQTSIEHDLISEATDTEWEEEQLPDHESDYSVETDKESDANVECLSESNSIKLDEINCGCNKEVLADEVLQDEESGSCSGESDDSDPERVGSELEDVENSSTAEDSDDEGASNSSQDIVEESLPAEIQDVNHSFHEGDQDEDSMDSEEQCDSGIHGIVAAENATNEDDAMEMEGKTGSGTEETILAATDKTSPASKSTFARSRSNSKQEISDTCDNLKWTTRCRTPIEDYEEQRKFNPREPNYLPVVPEPDAEKVDLKHQEIDDRKNTNEWMLDYALQQAVTKLAPARKRKVALLVEAFEAVLPMPKWETQAGHASATFAHGRPIQACS